MFICGENYSVVVLLLVLSEGFDASGTEEVEEVLLDDVALVPEVFEVPEVLDVVELELLLVVELELEVVPSLPSDSPGASSGGT